MSLLNQFRYLNYNPPWGTGPSYTTNGPYFTVGNVGIGTTGPTAPLTFSNSTGDKIVLSGTGTKTSGIGIQSNQLQIHAEQSSSDILFGYGSSSNFNELMRIKGNNGTGPLVGIGTNNPATTLDVGGSLKSTSTLTVNNFSNGTVGYFSLGILTNNSAVGTPARFKISVIGDDGYSIGSTNNYGGECVIYGSFLDNANQSSANINGNWYIQNSLSNLFITSVKFVQVGSNRNSYRVYVYLSGADSYQGTYLLSTSNVSFTPEFIQQTNPGADSSTVQTAVSRFTLQNSNLGIGTTNPTNPLTVNGNALIGTATTNNLKFTPGLYWNGSSTTSDSSAFGIGINTNGTSKVCFSDNIIINGGNLGIGLGTDTPNFPLSFGDSIGEKIVFWGNSTTANYGIGISGGQLLIHTDSINSDILFGYGSSTNFTQVMSISNAGQALTIPDIIISNAMLFNNNGGIYAANNGGGYEQAFIPRDSNNTMILKYGTGGFNLTNNNNTTYMSMDNSGQTNFFGATRIFSNVSVGGADGGYTLDVLSTSSNLMRLQTTANVLNTYLTNGVTTWRIFVDSDGGYKILNGSTGVRLAAGGTSWIGVSDRRLKTDIVPIENNLEKILGINPVYFRFKTDLDDPKMPSRRVGFIAQDVQTVLPEAVHCMQNENIKDECPDGVLGITPTDIIPICVGGIRELVEENNSLKQQVSSLESEVEDLKNINEQLQAKLQLICTNLGISF